MQDRGKGSFPLAHLVWESVLLYEPVRLAHGQQPPRSRILGSTVTVSPGP